MILLNRTIIPLLNPNEIEVCKNQLELVERKNTTKRKGYTQLREARRRRSEVRFVTRSRNKGFENSGEFCLLGLLDVKDVFNSLKLRCRG